MAKRLKRQLLESTPPPPGFCAEDGGFNQIDVRKTHTYQLVGWVVLNPRAGYGRNRAALKRLYQAAQRGEGWTVIKKV